MAKIPFTKLNKIKQMPVVLATIADTEITVVQYLPLAQKLDLIQTVIELSGNSEEGFFNIVKLQTYYTIEMIKAYTNISFTDKQQEDITKLYDAIILNNIWDEIALAIPQEEQEYIWDNLLNLAREVTDYNHSALGILKAVGTDYSNLNFEAEDIKEKIANPENLKLLKGVMEKLG